SFSASGDGSSLTVHSGITDQVFHGVKKIVATMGGGAETLDLSGVSDASIEEDITGGSGTDTFRAGNGNVTFDGGSGSDTIYGYNGAGPGGVENLIGGTGDDTFFAQQAATAIMTGGQGTNNFTGGTGINEYVTGSVTDVINAGLGFNDYRIDPNAPSVQIVRTGSNTAGVLDFSAFTDGVTFYLEHGQVLAVWGGEDDTVDNSTIGFSDVKGFAHEAYGTLDAFKTILGGKGADIFNVWETDNTDPLILDGQGGSDVYNVFGYDAGHANSTVLKAEIEDANVTTTGNVTTSSGAT